MVVQSCSLSSIRTQSFWSLFATMPVVPTPPKGSSTVPPGRQPARMQRPGRPSLLHGSPCSSFAIVLVQFMPGGMEDPGEAVLGVLAFFLAQGIKTDHDNVEKVHHQAGDFSPTRFAFPPGGTLVSSRSFLVQLHSPIEQFSQTVKDLPNHPVHQLRFLGFQ